MIDNKKIEMLGSKFQRIFGLPMSRSTLREIQNAIIEVVGVDEKEVVSILEALMSDKQEKKEGQFQRLIDQYAIPVKLARDVMEKGEYINLITSDFIAPQQHLALVYNIRRIDGQEIRFVADIDGSLRLAKHLLGRLNELKKNEKTDQLLGSYRTQIDELKSLIEKL